MTKHNPGYVPSSPFEKPLTDAHMRLFHEMPKVELHAHLLGTVRKQTYQDLAKKHNAPLTTEQIDEFYTRGEKPVGVLRILRALDSYLLLEAEDLYRITYEYLEDAAAHNIRYAEFFWNPTGTAHVSKVPYPAAQAAIIKAIHAAEAKFGIIGRLLPSIDREADPDFAVEMVEWMLANPAPEVIGVGIDYRENDRPPELFWKAYKMAKDNGYKITVHAGEFGMPWRNVETAVKLLDCDRVDHGYTIVDNPALVEYCKQKDLIFTVVPTNSYYMRTLEPERWALDHPIRKMVAMGLRIHPNTDDPTMHQINATEVWQLMYNFLGLSLENLRSFMINGIDGAWVDEATKQKWKAEWPAKFDELAKGL
ncbi:MAG: adenosine deaminase [Deferribacteraceae bacterium]|jgi:adenosine deaminase|nr:adenosine deaminase [Deferribacteraceae bacterium]